MTYLITGATGDVGARVVQRLIQQGIRPRILVRSAAKAQALFGQAAEIAEGDLTTPATIQSAMKDVHTLFLVNVGPEILPAGRGRSDHRQRKRRGAHRQAVVPRC